jgi:ubiquinone/menaquinone biosynthesis C-methylase UbiE
MHEKISRDHMHIIKPQKVILTDFPASGYVLDIGGGGEGIIGLMKPEQVVAIDHKKSELEEAPPGPSKIVMDATDLQFLNESFSTVTSFFSLMFIKPGEKRNVFQEVYRVLQEEGHFLIWDAIIPPRDNHEEQWFVVPLQIEIGNTSIETAYGVGWAVRTQNMKDIEKLAEEIGFTIIETKKKDQIFFYDFLK